MGWRDRIKSRYQSASVISPNEDRAGQPALRDDQLLVAAASGIAQHDALAALAAHEVAGREHVDAGNLEIGRDHAAGVAARGSPQGATPAPAPARRPAPPGHSRCRDARRIRRSRRYRRAGCELIVDDDAAVDGDACGPGQIGIGRMPAANTTRSAAMRRPSENSTASTPACPRMRAVLALRRTVMPLRSTSDFSISAAATSSCRSINRSIRWTRVTCAPALASP